MLERIDQTLQQIGRGATSAGELLPRILQDPRAYPRETMLAAVVLALAIVLLVLLVFVMSDAISETLRRRRSGVVVRRDRWWRIALGTVIAAGIGGLIALAPMSAAVDDRCASCHAIEDAVEAWRAGSHAEVSCLRCHTSGGATGAFQASWAGIARLTGSRSAVDTDSVGSTQVFSAGCLDCHQEVAEGVVGDEVRMRHSDVIAAGLVCERCHESVGHETLERVGRVTESRMNTCLGCHDGTTADAGCPTCHVTDPMDPSGLETAGNGPIAVTCDGCHAPETERACIECHGLVLPHPPEFFGMHAGMSSNDPALCASCHEAASADRGCACHDGDVNVHGTYDDWFPLHGTNAKINGPGGCLCHDTASFCGMCHETNPF